MTSIEISEILSKTNIPVAHICFEDEQSAPYICYIETSSELLTADGNVVFQNQKIDVELYHSNTDMDCEIVLENQLRNAGITYEKTTQWLQDISLLETIYTIGME